MSLSERLKNERAKKGLSQQKLAELSSTHYSNIGRYERGDAKPSADVINRIAQVLEVSPDYLINGTMDDKAGSTITDERLLQQFRKIERLPENKKAMLIEFLDGFIFKANVQQMA